MKLTNENIIAIAQIITTLIISVLAGTFGLYQWDKSTKVKRAEFINQIIDKLRFDNEMVKIVYLIEYTYDWYTHEFHNGFSDLEFRIDKLLSYLTYICYLKDHKIISKSEFSILEYEIYRTCESPCVQAYLWNLYHFTEGRSTKCTFDRLIKYGIEKDIFTKDFKDKNSTVFPKYLNF